MGIGAEKIDDFDITESTVERQDQRLHDADGTIRCPCISPLFQTMGARQVPCGAAGGFVDMGAEVDAVFDLAHRCGETAC